jgi:enoyl-[acyl-carrier protein] reductase/trans-2-enoyl-CoA reductase (NAD+)
VVGSSTGYGLASRITAAFACGASTIGVSFDKAATDKKPGTAGWYNTVAFDKAAKEEGLYTKSIIADAFAHETRKKVIEIIKEDLGQIDLLVYSIAAPVRKLPDSDELVRSTLKPIGQPYSSKAINTGKDELYMAITEPATEQEVQDTITVMGGQDWELWVQALKEAGVLAEGFQTTAYSYIGTEITWPLYWHGSIGKAKEDLERAARALSSALVSLKGNAYVSVLKSVVTQASSAIPVLPLYIAIVFKVMREKGLHEGCIEQINRLFRTKLYGDRQTDSEGRLRVDDWELREDVQMACNKIWAEVDQDSLFEKTDYELYKQEFLQLFGFEVDGVDYSKDVNPEVVFDGINLT